MFHSEWMAQDLETAMQGRREHMKKSWEQEEELALKRRHLASSLRQEAGRKKERGADRGSGQVSGKSFCFLQ